MFVGLKKPLEQGQRIQPALKFEKACDIEFKVEPIGAHVGCGSATPGGMQMQHGRWLTLRQ